MARSRTPWMIGTVVLLLLGLALGVLELTGIAAYSRASLMVMLTLAAIQLATGVLVVALSRRARFTPASPRVVIAAACIAAAAIAWTAAAIWPNSSDEYGYVYAARTLLAGRLYNPAPPTPDLFELFWIGVHEGRAASQYSPGWPVVLVPFLAAHVLPLANPVLLLALGALLWDGLRRVGASRAAGAALLALVMLAPFTLFNAASLFNHVMAAACVMGVCCLQLRDDAGPSAWNKAGIGILLSIALTTRIEAFAITTALLGLDCLWRQRLRAVRTAGWIALGAMPVTLLWLGYNAAITGHPFTTTQAWVAPEQLAFAIPTLGALAARQSWYGSELLSFVGLAMPLLYAAALWTRLRTRRLRFFDLLLPAAIVFFTIYPADGGHQYGPRYWFFAWPAMALTIGAAAEQDAARLFRLRLHLPTLAGLQVIASLGFTLCFAVFLRLYVDERRAVYAAQPPATPAIVLIPDRDFRISRWQPGWFGISARDLTRNDLDVAGPVLYGRGDDPRFERLACALPGRHVYRWVPPASFTAIDCR